MDGNHTLHTYPGAASQYLHFAFQLVDSFENSLSLLCLPTYLPVPSGVR